MPYFLATQYIPFWFSHNSTNIAHIELLLSLPLQLWNKKKILGHGLMGAHERENRKINIWKCTGHFVPSIISPCFSHYMPFEPLQFKFIFYEWKNKVNFQLIFSFFIIKRSFYFLKNFILIVLVMIHEVKFS